MARDKRREELYVTVPSLFRCPISMDVMKSPVSLCTGVTYDRSSIEKWLSLGHNTCPATMQTLPDTHTTPNLTLRRLIHLWLAHADATHAAATAATISKLQVAEIIKGEFDSDANLAKVVSFMTASEENLRFVALSNDAVARFVEAFAKCGENEIRICEAIVEILDLISPEKGVRERLSELILGNRGGGDCLSSLILVLRKGKSESKAKSAKILQLIAVNPESQRRIAEKTGLLNELHNLSSSDADKSAIEAALSALVSISTTRPAKKELIKLGIVQTLAKILSDSDHSPAIRPIIEKALALLETVATCTEGRSAISEDRECVVAVVKRLMKCSGAATEHGVTVLWSVCCLARDHAAAEKVAGVNGLTKVLVVMQSDCAASTRQMCGELVRVLRAKNAKSNLAPYETRTTHITPY